MPHFILECSDKLIKKNQEVMQTVFRIADKSGLFQTAHIKVRMRPYSNFLHGGDDKEFLHVFAYIMEGRTTEQKNALSKAIVTGLKESLLEVPIISMNVMDFERATYNNRDTV